MRGLERNESGANAARRRGPTITNPLRLLPALVLVATAAAQPSPTLTVRGSGAGSDQAEAEKAAIADALRQAASAVLDEATFKKHREAVAGAAGKATDAVTEREVLKTEKAAGRQVLVRVRVTVDRAKLLTKLAEAKVPVPGVAGKDDPSAGLGEKVVKFCKDNKGKMVGDGECGTLAQAAIREAGGKRVDEFAESPGPGDYAWGELVFVLEVQDGKRKREPGPAGGRHPVPRRRLPQGRGDRHLPTPHGDRRRGQVERRPGRLRAEQPRQEGSDPGDAVARGAGRRVDPGVPAGGEVVR
jgi:hypothetical protein